MPDILALFQCLHPTVSSTTIRRLSQIVRAMVVMTGRVTMLGISRWTDEGGSYRTVQRWFATAIPWPHVLWLFFQYHAATPDDVYILAGDEVVVTKAGKHTYGLDRFFAGLYRTTVPSVAFFTLALVSTTQRRAFPLRVEQVVRSAAEKAASKAKQTACKGNAAIPKRAVGRPKGSTNNHKAVAVTPELQRIQIMLQDQLALMADYLSVRYVALDGHFGNHNALHMVRHCDLHLISKLRTDAALYLPDTGPYQGRGAHRKYGAKLDYHSLPDQYLRETLVEGRIETRQYHLEVLHHAFAQPLNVVIIVKINRDTQAQGHAILFSSDRALPAAQLVAYYSLRFQIEFAFRDAKQYWGLEDFMNVAQTSVTNAANLALFMVTLVSVLLEEVHHHAPHASVLDLKAYYRGHTYVTETLKLLPEMPDAIIIDQIYRHVARLGQIHPTESRLAAA